jgi:hypothetical protein
MRKRHPKKAKKENALNIQKSNDEMQKKQHFVLDVHNSSTTNISKIGK